ncbi:Os06g0297350, partial [Oryza sativa Japonica Group]
MFLRSLLLKTSMTTASDATRAMVFETRKAMKRPRWRSSQMGSPASLRPASWACSQVPPGGLIPATYVTVTTKMASSIKTL